MCRGALRGKALPRPMLPALGGAAALGLGGGGPLPLCSHAQGQDLNGISSIMLTKGVHHAKQGMPSDHTGVLWKPGWRRYGVLPHA